MVSKEKFNDKITKKGVYTPFYGWSLISMLLENMSFLENYVKHNNVINKYFAALPSSSYHVTLFNIWSNGCPLLEEQKKKLKESFPEKNIEEFEKESKEPKPFNPKGCINDLLYKIQYEVSTITTDWKLAKLVFKQIIITKHTIHINFQEKNQEQLNFARGTAIFASKRDDYLGYYHLTLGYSYRKIEKSDMEILTNEINILNMLLANQVFTVGKPEILHFESMKTYYPIKKSLEFEETKIFDD